MGLDMYLYAKKYIGGWDHSDEKDRAKFAKLGKLTGITPTSDSPSFYITATVGYWRKANAIHKWFVDVVQKGKDDCGTYSVSREQLAALKELCEKAIAAGGEKPGLVTTGTTFAPGKLPKVTRVEGTVVKNKKAVAALLPTTSGFFFGSTDYDEWYIQDLKDTITIIDNCLTNTALEGSDFEYYSSW